MPASVAYFIHRDQQTTGPFSEDEVRAKFHAGEIQEDTLVAKEGSTHWIPLSETTLSEPNSQLKTDGTGSTTAAATDLQFDRAEFTQPKSGAVTCSICKQPVHDAYFHINGRVACAACKERIQTSGAGRITMIGFGKSVLFGTGAAIAGAIVWYAVSELTHVQWGLIGIVIGYLVGIAVRKGSRGWGGWQYQTLAMVLTYLSIVSTYIPPLLNAIDSGRDIAATHPIIGNNQSGSNNSAPNPVIKYALVFALACAAPFLAGAQYFLGWIIISIALYQAWKINRRVPLEISGPYKIAPTPVAT
jgi:hypothetical protein